MSLVGVMHAIHPVLPSCCSLTLSAAVSQLGSLVCAVEISLTLLDHPPCFVPVLHNLTIDTADSLSIAMLSSLSLPLSHLDTYCRCAKAISSSLNRDRYDNKHLYECLHSMLKKAKQTVLTPKSLSSDPFPCTAAAQLSHRYPAPADRYPHLYHLIGVL